MARGWESKNIEAQQEEAKRGEDGRTARRAEQPPAVRERRRMLELARARAQADLAAASAPAHRDMLRQAIEAINQQLEELSGVDRTIG